MSRSLSGSKCSRVLIVDECDDNREVLRTALERRGLETLEASGPQQGLELARRHHPQVIVLDLESGTDGDTTVREQYAAETRKNDLSLVVLGTATRTGCQGPDHQEVAKPYHYAPLIRTIEKLIS